MLKTFILLKFKVKKYSQKVYFCNDKYILKNENQLDLTTFFTIIAIIIIGLIIKFSPFFRNIPGIGFNLLFIFFFVKCIVGFFYLYIYSHYYDSETADVYKYFHDGMIIVSAFKDNPLDYLRMVTGIDSGAEHLNVYYSQMISWFRPWNEPAYNDNLIVIRFNAIVGLISGGSIGIHNVVANFLSFTGIIAILKFTVGKIHVTKLIIVFWGLLLFPSVLFWGSGILKESILFFSLGLFIYYSDKLIRDRENIILCLANILISAIILMLLKSYVILILIPLLATYFIIRNKEKKALILLYPAVFIIYAGLFIIAGYFIPEYNPLTIIAEKQNSFVIFSEHVEAGSIISSRLMKPEILSFLSFIPEGFWNTLSRPHFGDGNSILVLLAAFENLLIWILILIMLFFSDKSKRFNQFFWLNVCFVIATFTFIGMVTPIYGGLVRYKIPALLFLWIAFIYIIDYERIKQLMILLSKRRQK